MPLKRAGTAHLAHDNKGKVVGISIRMSGRELTRLMRALERVGPKTGVVFEAALSSDGPPWDSLMWSDKTHEGQFKVCFELALRRR